MNKLVFRTNAVVIMSSAVISLVIASTCQAACDKTQPLFVVERSKNGNTVHYDLCLGSDGNPSDTEPVVSYWVLEDGKKEELSNLDRAYAYGIVKYKKLEEGTLRITLVKMKERPIAIEKNGDRYNAKMPIDGKDSMLEKIYIKAIDPIIGLPHVQFIELYGRTKGEGLPVRERIDKE
jgi:hypothetical protein